MTHSNNKDFNDFTRFATAIAVKFQQIFYEYFIAQKQGLNNLHTDWLNLSQSFQVVMQKLWLQPEQLVKMQMGLWQQYAVLWQDLQLNWLGKNFNDALPRDRRFSHKEWQENPLFLFFKEAYLLTTRTIYQCIEEVKDLDKKTVKEALFYARQLLDALAPSNFVLTNPEVLQLTLETIGENLLQGLDNFLADLKQSQGTLHIKMTDFSAFRVGENIAITPGKVIYQNRLMQLIQYAPTTEQVYAKPLLIVPPWINKYYILDLSPKNSFVKWVVEQGYTVFMISWVNPDASFADTDFEDYMQEGPISALEAIEKAVGAREVNTLGFCIGGTLLASTLAYLAAKQDKRVCSATYLATLLDFSEPGDLGVFISEEKMQLIEAYMANMGYLPGRDMAMIFNLLRDNDLIWPYFVNNYLKGKQPAAFDLLYWNSDFTNLPAKMYHFYLSNMYIKNKLREPNGITLANTPISLKNITTPTYFISTKEDHIAPWRSIYQGVHLFGGSVRFVLGASGHIAGIINSPAVNKYDHWINTDLPPSAEAWLQAAQLQKGSWWVDWANWLAARSGEQIPAMISAAGIEPAPGSYVKKRAV